MWHHWSKNLETLKLEWQCSQYLDLNPTCAVARIPKHTIFQCFSFGWETQNFIGILDCVFYLYMTSLKPVSSHNFALNEKTDWTEGTILHTMIKAKNSLHLLNCCKNNCGSFPMYQKISLNAKCASNRYRSKYQYVFVMHLCVLILQS